MLVTDATGTRGFCGRQIRARPCVGDERPPQVGPAVTTQVAPVADPGPELLGRVRSVARLAKCDWVVRAQREEQRSESDEQQHRACIVVLRGRVCQAAATKSSVEGCRFWWMTNALLNTLLLQCRTAELFPHHNFTCSIAAAEIVRRC